MHFRASCCACRWPSQYINQATLIRRLRIIGCSSLLMVGQGRMVRRKQSSLASICYPSHVAGSLNADVACSASSQQRVEHLQPPPSGALHVLLPAIHALLLPLSPCQQRCSFNTRTVRKAGTSVVVWLCVCHR